MPAYIVNPNHEGSRNEIRRFISAPQISFDITAVYAPLNSKTLVPVASGDPGSYVGSELRPEDAPLPGQSIGVPSESDLGEYYDSATLGGAKSGRNTVEVVRVYKDAVSGETVSEILPFKQRNERKGETVYQAQLTDDLGTITVVPK